MDVLSTFLKQQMQEILVVPIPHYILLYLKDSPSLLPPIITHTRKMENQKNFQGCSLIDKKKLNKNRNVILFHLLLLSIIELFLKEMRY
jgi:hypothetical protein